MGFFYTNEKSKQQGRKQFARPSVGFLHNAECKACPLNYEADLNHPKMQPTGANKPLVYMLGPAPTEADDRQGKHFVGKSGQVLRMRIPSDFNGLMRWNNVIRTKPPEKRDPEFVEIECCRPSIVRDIEECQPVAIFGFGNVPLHWLLGQTGIKKWAGRRVPVKVGQHTCWFFPMLDPALVMESRKFEPRGDGYGSEDEFKFAMDLWKALECINDLPEPIVHTEAQARANLQLITGSNKNDLQELLSALEWLRDSSLVGFDYETNALRPYNKNAKILTAAVSDGDRTVAFGLEHRQCVWSENDLDRIKAALSNLLSGSYGPRKVVHNLAFEMEWTAEFFSRGCLHGSQWGCTAAQAYVLDERMKMGKPDCLSLEFLVLQYFGFNLKKLSNLDTNNLDSAPLEEVLRYNAMDAKYHRLLFLEQRKRLKDEKLQEIYEHHLTRIPTTVLTQRKGIPVNQTMVEKFARKYHEELQAVEKEINQLPIVLDFKRRKGHDYQPSAPADFLYLGRHILNLPLENADEDALAKIKHPIAALTLRWRKANKNLSTYVSPLMDRKTAEIINADLGLTGKNVEVPSPLIFPGGLIHPVLSTMQTSTSRTSSEDPNSQNFPKRQNRAVRGQIKHKSDDYRVVSFDYGQIQARNVAMESKDPTLIKAFWDRYDIHTDWAKRAVQLYPNWVEGGASAFKDKTILKKYRDKAKNGFVFPSFFGARPKKVAKELGNLPEKIGEQLQEEFFDRFRSVKTWHVRLERMYRDKGYVTGLSGYRRRAPIDPNQLINAPIQADEAMIVLNAMYRLSKLGDERLQANMEIHDDLTFIWHKDEIDQLAPIVIREMLDCPYKWVHIVPLSIEMSVGPDWASQKEIGKFESDTWDGTFRQVA